MPYLRDRHPLYTVWIDMRRRCGNANHPAFARYGGRGISVCERWANSFQSFVDDIGPRPEGTSIDRYPDNNGNYEPGNCRWATAAQQNSNKRNMHFLEYGGETKSITEWARLLRVDRKTLYSRVAKYGVEKALDPRIDHSKIRRGRNHRTLTAPHRSCARDYVS